MTDGQGRVGLDPFRVRDGVLTITADRTPEGLAPRLGGYRYDLRPDHSQPSFRQTYGYFEMRAACRAARGCGRRSGCCRRTSRGRRRST
jgi:hypothetical protein